MAPGPVAGLHLEPSKFVRLEVEEICSDEGGGGCQDENWQKTSRDGTSTVGRLLGEHTTHIT